MHDDSVLGQFRVEGVHLQQSAVYLAPRVHAQDARQPYIFTQVVKAIQCNVHGKQLLPIPSFGSFGPDTQLDIARSRDSRGTCCPVYVSKGGIHGLLDYFRDIYRLCSAPVSDAPILCPSRLTFNALHMQAEERICHAPSDSSLQLLLSPLRRSIGPFQSTAPPRPPQLWPSWRCLCSL